MEIKTNKNWLDPHISKRIEERTQSTNNSYDNGKLKLDFKMLELSFQERIWKTIINRGENK